MTFSFKGKTVTYMLYGKIFFPLWNNGKFEESETLNNGL